MFKVIRGKAGCGHKIEADGKYYLALSEAEVIKACEHYIWKHEAWKEGYNPEIQCPICIKRFDGRQTK